MIEALKNMDALSFLQITTNMANMAMPIIPIYIHLGMGQNLGTGT